MSDIPWSMGNLQVSVQKRIIFHLQKLSFPIDSQLGVAPGGDLSCNVGLGVDFPPGQILHK